jgi:hypothetical protein
LLSYLRLCQQTPGLTSGFNGSAPKLRWRQARPDARGTPILEKFRPPVRPPNRTTSTAEDFSVSRLLCEKFLKISSRLLGSCFVRIAAILTREPLFAMANVITTVPTLPYSALATRLVLEYPRRAVTGALIRPMNASRPSHCWGGTANLPAGRTFSTHRGYHARKCLAGRKLIPPFQELHGICCC